MSEAVVKKDRGEVEYIPFGSEDKIRLHVGIVQNLIAVKTKSGKTCSDTDAIKFIAMCQAKHLNPFEGDAYLIGYDSRDGGATFGLITAHQTYLKRAELHPEFDGMESGVIVREKETGALKDLLGDFYVDSQTVVGGWATVHFKTRKHAMSKRVRLDTFKKPFGVWLDNAAGMICKCAEADALRSAFPTMLGGLYLREELEVTERADSKDFKRPLFGQAGATTMPEPENGNGQKVVDAGPTPPGATGEVGPLSRLRAAMDGDGIKEGEVLDYVGDIGSLDESATSLEELQLTGNGLLIKALLDNWAHHSEEIIKRKAK